MAQFNSNSIFWVEVDKIHSNPYQPRKEFDEYKLNELAESLRQYGVLQPLVVTRKELTTEDGGIRSEYEIIAGERRLRAARIGGLQLVPVIIRSDEEDSKTKLEIAIIENLQREDLNPIDRAMAFQRLAEEFSFKHSQIAQKVGKSREYVSNSTRLLTLPEEMQNAISDGRVPEGHARSMLMLNKYPEEQQTLFKEIIYKKITAREAERIARNVASERTRKPKREDDPQVQEMEKKLTNKLGTRVQIEKRKVGGKLVIDYFSNEDLQELTNFLESKGKSTDMMERYIEQQKAASGEQSAGDISFAGQDYPQQQAGQYSPEDSSMEATPNDENTNGEDSYLSGAESKKEEPVAGSRAESFSEEDLVAGGYVSPTQDYQQPNLESENGEDFSIKVSDMNEEQYLSDQQKTGEETVEQFPSALGQDEGPVFKESNNIPKQEGDELEFNEEDKKTKEDGLSFGSSESLKEEYSESEEVFSKSSQRESFSRDGRESSDGSFGEEVSQEGPDEEDDLYSVRNFHI